MIIARHQSVLIEERRRARVRLTHRDMEMPGALFPRNYILTPPSRVRQHLAGQIRRMGSGKTIPVAAALAPFVSTVLILAAISAVMDQPLVALDASMI